MTAVARIVAGLAFAGVAFSGGPALAGPLHDAARAGESDLLHELLAGGASIDERDDLGATPLIVAAAAGHTPIVDYLLTNGADMTLRDNRGWTALHAAAQAGDGMGVAFFVGEGPFHGKLDIDDAENELGVTPLIAAAEQNRGNIVAYLASTGADIELADKQGRTALTIAGLKGNDEIVTILLRVGAVCQEGDPTWLAECTERKAALGS
jgi:ankyrin repeat protein